MDKALAIEENRIKSFNQTTNSSAAKPIGLLYAKKASYLNVSLLFISERLLTLVTVQGISLVQSSIIN